MNQAPTSSHAAPHVDLDVLGSARKHYALGNYSEVVTLLDEAVLAAADSEERVSALILLGKSLRETGELAAAKAQFHRAQAIAVKSGDKKQQASAHNQLASLEVAGGDLLQAILFLNEADAIYQGLGATFERADVLNNLGNLYQALGQFEEALTALTTGFELLKSERAVSRTAIINLQNLGLTYQAIGRLDRAQAFFADAKDKSLQFDDPILRLVSIGNLAEVLVEQAQYQSAEQTFEEAYELAKTHGLKAYEIGILLGLGKVYYHKALYTRAHLSHEQALALARLIGDKGQELEGLLALAQDNVAIHNYAEAIGHAQSALLIAEQSSQPKLLCQCHTLLASAYKHQGAFERAYFHLEASSLLEQDLFNERDRDKTRILSVRFETEKARHEAELFKLRSQLEQNAHQQARQLVAQRTAELEQAQVEIVTRLAVAAEYRDEDTGEHTHRVGRIAALIAAQMGWALEDIKLLYLAARLHDVGKIGISDTILHKPGTLTDQEYDTVRKHTVYGAKILADGHSPLLKLAEEIALNHHERWDGRGYPAGHAGDAVPLSARIVSVADVLDALTHERPYKAAWTLEEALAEIERNRGTQFDPAVVDVCAELFSHLELSPMDGAGSWETLHLELQALRRA